MSKENRSKEVKQKRQSGCIILEEQVNRLGILFDQIEGCAQLLEARLLEVYDYHSDSGSMTAINVLKERAKECDAIIGGSYGKLPPEVLRVRENNLKARDTEVAERSEYEKTLEKRRKAINRALERADK